MSAPDGSYRKYLEGQKKDLGLNTVLSYKWYMEYLCSELGTSDGGKALLLDKDTMVMMSMVYSMSEALKHNVYSMERIDKERQNTTTSLECIVFVRPTDMNVQHIKDELEKPHFARYHIVWNNVIGDKRQQVDEIAKADCYGLVSSMKELYGDFYAVHDGLFHFDVTNSLMRSTPQRTVDGLMSVLLAHKRYPCIKYQGSSPRCADLAQRLDHRIEGFREEFNPFQQYGTPTLFIWDRREDAVTPLLKPWTYQAMVHELLGINYNRVKCKSEEHVVNPGFRPSATEPFGGLAVAQMDDGPGKEKARTEAAKSAKKEAFPDEAQDEFFACHMFKNFGDIGLLLKEAIEVSASSSKLKKSSGASIEDLQAMVAEMPEMRHKNMIAMKHWDIFKELKAQVDSRDIFDVSMCEQNLAARQEHNEAKDEVRHLVQKLISKDCIYDAMRLVMLYNLRYEKSQSCITQELVGELLRGLKGDNVHMIQKVIQYGGADARKGPGAKAMGNETMMAKMWSMGHAKMDLMGMGDVNANDLIQHTPLVKSILDDLMAGKLKNSEYPELGPGAEARPKEIIMFIVGGATYAEAATIHEWNKEHPECNVILGSTMVHNSASFIEEVENFKES